jgi:hypothetical protein
VPDHFSGPSDHTKSICRRVEDFAIIVIGPGLFKIGRLLSVVLLTVHLLACLFWRVKLETADPAAIADFLLTRGIPADVSA